MAALLEREEWKAFSDFMALVASGLLALVGLILALAGKEPVMKFHGCLLLGAAGLAFLYILTQMIKWSEPRTEAGYADGVIRAGVIATVFWGLAGFLVGDIIAWQLAFPALNLDLPWTSFGRLRPLHTSAVIFAFGGNALIATSLYVVQRTSRARLAGRWSPWFVFWGYQLFIVLAATGYLLGVTQSKEYAEPEWYVDLWLTAVWVVYFLVFIGTLARRREPHIYVANWFYLAFIVTVAMLHIVNNLAVPISLLGSKSYVIYSGVQDAMTQWWYGHNAVGFFLTAGFLGMMYYFVPKRAERPIYSYRLSIVHFWSLIFLYIWAGPHHLHYTALPDWAQTLGMTFSIMLWMPSWGGMIPAPARADQFLVQMHGGIRVADHELQLVADREAVVRLIEFDLRVLGGQIDRTHVIEPQRQRHRRCRCSSPSCRHRRRSARVGRLITVVSIVSE